MLGAISAEGYVFIVGGLFFLCSICLVLLAAAALGAVLKPRRRFRTEAFPYDVTVKDRSRRGPSPVRQSLDTAEELRRAA